MCCGQFSEAVQHCLLQVTSITQMFQKDLFLPIVPISRAPEGFLFIPTGAKLNLVFGGSQRIPATLKDSHRLGSVPSLFSATDFCPLCAHVCQGQAMPAFLVLLYLTGNRSAYRLCCPPTTRSSSTNYLDS